MPRTLGWIRQFHDAESPNCPPLLVFPHAGAGASAYRGFSKALSKNFDVIVFQYPGRQDRVAEAPLGSLNDMAAGAFEEFSASQRRCGVPIVTFGHSMGAIVAFEFVRLAEAHGVEVLRLNASAAVAPCRAAAMPPHPSDDDGLLDNLTALQGTDAAVLANREIMKLALPVIRADYAAFDAYLCAPEARIAAPIHAMAGDKDPDVTLGDLYDWGKHTAAVTVTMFDGGHFYLESHLDVVAKLLV
ncbi:thioesterase [Mycobacterium sp. 1100029.7]|nr:thioesterase [Mycobacterium sp. 1100029.7]